jgi:DNA mismatch repair protein MSH2
MINVFSKYIEMIETTVDLDRIRNHEFVIKPDYDKDLKGFYKNIYDLSPLYALLFVLECRKKQDELESKMHDDLSSICDKLSPHLSSTPSRSSISKKNGHESTKDPIKLCYDPKQSGWLYKINRKESATLQKQLSNITIKVTKKEGIFFQTQRLNELNTKYTTLSSNYNETSKEVIDDVLNIACSYCDSLSQLAE